jgi:hypothetical protein
VGDLEIVVEAVQQHRDGGSDDLEVAEFLGGDVHEEVVHFRVLLPQHKGLREVLQCGGEFTVGAAELLHEQRCESWIGLVDPHLELKILVMSEHLRLPARSTGIRPGHRSRVGILITGGSAGL